MTTGFARLAAAKSGRISILALFVAKSKKSLQPSSRISIDVQFALTKILNLPQSVKFVEYQWKKFLKFLNKSLLRQFNVKLVKDKIMLPTKYVYFARMISMSNQKCDAQSAMSISRSVSSMSITIIAS
jgi:hypothetical protein